MRHDNSLVPIPGLGHQDVAVVQSLVTAAGFFCVVHDGFGECPDILFIRATDLPSIRELLQDYLIRSPRAEKIPIPW